MVVNRWIFYQLVSRKSCLFILSFYWLSHSYSLRTRVTTPAVETIQMQWGQLIDLSLCMHPFCFGFALALELCKPFTFLITLHLFHWYWCIITILLNQEKQTIRFWSISYYFIENEQTTHIAITLVIVMYMYNWDYKYTPTEFRIHACTKEKNLVLALIELKLLTCPRAISQLQITPNSLFGSFLRSGRCSAEVHYIVSPIMSVFSRKMNE